jgi:hypothetical protein
MGSKFLTPGKEQQHISNNFPCAKTFVGIITIRWIIFKFQQPQVSTTEGGADAD